jgi:hypothetical protein
MNTNVLPDECEGVELLTTVVLLLVVFVVLFELELIPVFALELVSELGLLAVVLLVELVLGLLTVELLVEPELGLLDVELLVLLFEVVGLLLLLKLPEVEPLVGVELFTGVELDVEPELVPLFEVDEPLKLPDLYPLVGVELFVEVEVEDFVDVLPLPLA